MTTSFEIAAILTIKKPFKSISIHIKNIVICLTYKLFISRKQIVVDVRLRVCQNRRQIRDLHRIRLQI